jgi:arylsulfatase A-like enzyme
MRWLKTARFKSCCVAAVLACSTAPEEGPPSILLVTLDTLRVDHVGAYAPGGKHTPALDALAAEGLVYENAYTTMPITGPAVLSLFTGLLPSAHGSRANGQPLALSALPRNLVGHLADAGYATAAFGTTSLLSYRFTGLDRFDVYDTPRGDEASGDNYTRLGEEAVNAALEWLGSEERRPVFLWVHFYDAHAPYGIREDWPAEDPFDWSGYGWVEAELYPDAPSRARMRKRYARGVREMDEFVGRLIRGVRDLLRRPPLVIAVADHGESLDEHLDTRGYAYDHGEFLDAESVRIPLLLAGPGIAPGRSAGTASILDLYTTILEAAEVGDAAAESEGRRDLRRPSNAPRAVGIERRAVRRSDNRVVDFLRRHAGAAGSARELVIVAEDGSVTLGVDAGPLVELARERAEVVGRVRVLAEPDAETLETLRSLGYVE